MKVERAIEQFQTVNEQLEAEGVIYIYATCADCNTKNMLRLPVVQKNREVEVSFACRRCGNEEKFFGIATPIVYKDGVA